ncbi:hypothetical protein PPL_04168 [Heterostelium album PN500]|uniref:ABC transporter domain-containing protein n=1 Tax=Heterostelium pallidum (strain ATCC 26659 / Pp 5 / PN500) TaxID=670386 RepID=D3B677_HETP5|nr:hypothetical protein PPL_04168 [Heterostelium album PN500]EFA83375.1 hypothetical protein PPL_04168 [Heterostelium album PN500]|eukprot:XP_020435492.1 hypothetical protein PPL_04168 [Heterostelium album PN500]
MTSINNSTRIMEIINNEANDHKNGADKNYQQQQTPPTLTNSIDRNNIYINNDNESIANPLEISNLENVEIDSLDLERGTVRNNNINRKVTITFKNVSFDLVKKKKQLNIIRDINGTVAPGELVGVFGPSGAGKTTLLDILAKRKTTGEVSGSILINGSTVSHGYKKICSYVTQEDNLLPTLTVQETLRFYADLRLPPTFSSQQKQERIKWVLEKIGLSQKANSKVGGPLPGGVVLRGLSGGEKRRVNIGCGLVTMPSIIILDEPTSGLDSSSAMLVMESLIGLTKIDHVTVVCSIHQPRSEIYHLFSKVLVLGKGRLVYYGSEPVKHFIDLGIPFPLETNPADYILDAVTKLTERGQINQIADSLGEGYTQQVDSYLKIYNESTPPGKENNIFNNTNHSNICMDMIRQFYF